MSNNNITKLLMVMLVTRYGVVHPLPAASLQLYHPRPAYLLSTTRKVEHSKAIVTIYLQLSWPGLLPGPDQHLLRAIHRAAGRRRRRGQLLPVPGHQQRGAAPQEEGPRGGQRGAAV